MGDRLGTRGAVGTQLFFKFFFYLFTYVDVEKLEPSYIRVKKRLFSRLIFFRRKVDSQSFFMSENICKSTILWN